MLSDFCLEYNVALWLVRTAPGAAAQISNRQNGNGVSRLFLVVCPRLARLNLRDMQPLHSFYLHAPHLLNRTPLCVTPLESPLFPPHCLTLLVSNTSHFFVTNHLALDAH